MAQEKKPSDSNNKLIAENRRARYDYAVEDTLECGVVLMGSEVKSLRGGGAHLTESYADVENGELMLINSYIALYPQARNFGHEERRRRKLLASKTRNIQALAGDWAPRHDAGSLEDVFQRQGPREAAAGCRQG